MTREIESILIANREEIATRIIRTCREMGIKSVAVYSELDRKAPYVAMADEAYPIGPTPARESYLNMDRIFEAADRAEVDAIHPGYGFLSENPSFSARCEEEELIFIGPTEDSIRTAGNKIRARRLARSANVPTVPGEVLEDQDVDQAGDIAEEIGFPVLIKAAAGGGGKGMRVVEEQEAFPTAFREARREAETAFGNPEVFIEKYFPSPRHIEIQVMVDEFNHAVHFGERECSIQRRHQKLVEEAPSTYVDSELRREMGEAATRLVEEAEYTGAGTVEFLVDQNRNFYFLEINTRLQVEHPVTEMITGYDLVREQIRVAQGQELGYDTEGIPSRGWALECRICAEDPDEGFVPSTGTIDNIVRPEGPFTRFDGGVQKGSRLTMHYDSLIGKLICWGQDRDQAVQRMKRALRETVIVGIQTTIPLHLELLENEDVLDGNLNTRFLDDFVIGKDTTEQTRKAAKLAAVLQFQRDRSLYASGGNERIGSGERSSSWFERGLREAMNNGE